MSWGASLLRWHAKGEALFTSMDIQEKPWQTWFLSKENPGNERTLPEYLPRGG